MNPESFVQQPSSRSAESRNRISSPCVSICALNDEGFCIGCYRDGNEIRLWNTYTEAQKQQVLNSCQRRAEIDKAFM
ncbi:DUF1289 domain-containing protein [Oceanospirillum sediminis]|uniref:DUF1289 domain-containing protein n=1 Tax=Oceanospirillum sediminis TaxID=2760088 RepID=A0A839IQ40_9GAMM|nr:DUF1289 domain-containing protein [Oceanospirillum sediminis]